MREPPGKSGKPKAESRGPGIRSPLSAFRFPLSAILLLCGLGATPALAHRINLVAPVQGQSIAGEAYYADGTPARNAKVSVFGPAGQPFGETTTDGEGRFVFPLRFCCDHRVVVDAGEGHTKTVTVPAKEIPATLPAWTGGALPSAGETPAPAGKGDSHVLPERPAANLRSVPGFAQGVPVTFSGPELPAQLAALGEQVAVLRREVARYENKVRLHDVLGGIGCILGLMGLAFYFLGVRRKEKAESGKRKAEIYKQKVES